MVGLSRADWQRLKPALSRENEQVLQVWDFCEGWNPQLVPSAAAFFGINDLDFLLTQLLLLRERLTAYRQAQKETHGKRS